jgi:hypothetical protein
VAPVAAPAAPQAAYCTAGPTTGMGFYGMQYDPQCGVSYVGVAGGTWDTVASYADCEGVCDYDLSCMAFSFLLTAATNNCYWITSSSTPVADTKVDSGMKDPDSM